MKTSDRRRSTRGNKHNLTARFVRLVRLLWNWWARWFLRQYRLQILRSPFTAVVLHAFDQWDLYRNWFVSIRLLSSDQWICSPLFQIHRCSGCGHCIAWSKSISLPSSGRWLIRSSFSYWHYFWRCVSVGIRSTITKNSTDLSLKRWTSMLWK